MNILVTLNDNYVRPLFVMLESLFDHEKGPIDVYLLYSDISEENRKKLDAFVRGRGNRLLPVYVGDDVFRDAPVCEYFTKEMYYRLLCSQLLPDTADRVLYLDPDILIRGSVAPLYETEFSGKQLAAVADYGVNCLYSSKKFALGFDQDEIYVNSGVLLFNLEKMRETFVLRDFLGLLERYGKVISYPDQDLINLYFKNDIIFTDKIYNYNPSYHGPRKLLAYVFGGNREPVEPVIVHFVGPTKPWHISYYSKYYFEYYRYLKPLQSRKERAAFFFKPCVVAGELAVVTVKYVKELIRSAKSESRRKE